MLESLGPHFTWLLVAAALGVGIYVLLVDLFLFGNLRRDEESRGRDLPVPRVWRVATILGSLAVAILLTSSGSQRAVDAAVAPLGAVDVGVSIGEQGWEFRYSPEVAVDTLHVPDDRPVHVTLAAADRAYTLKIPAVGVSATAWPELTNERWFEASARDTLDLWAESGSPAPIDSLRSALLVHRGVDFDSWLASKSDLLKMYPPIEAGRRLVDRNGCLVCHSLDGTTKTGPSFAGVLGRSRRFADGSSLVSNADYVRQSIREPQSQIVEGFPGVMPSFAGKLRDADIDAILAYFETLSGAAEVQ